MRNSRVGSDFGGRVVGVYMGPLVESSIESRAREEGVGIGESC